ncbi:MAG: hypothetical protein ABEJ72_03580 [Candidatus Aenigmatarchaeota archaeon]
MAGAADGRAAALLNRKSRSLIRGFRKDQRESREPHEHDDWLVWAKEENSFSEAKDDVPEREDKEPTILEAIPEILGYTPNSLNRKRNDLDAYDTNPEADETFRRDFFELAKNELEHNLGIDSVQGGGEVDLRDLDNFVKYVHTSGSETLESDRNSYIKGVHDTLGINGEAEGLNIVKTINGNLELALEDVESGVLYAISGDDLTADLPDLEGYSDVYLISRNGDVDVDAGEVGSGAHLYAESFHGDACVTVDGVDEDGVVYVNSTGHDSHLRDVDMEGDSVSVAIDNG